MMNVALVLAVMLIAASCEATLKHKKHVVELTDSNFDEVTSEGRWIVAFHAPWCGHCKQLAPVLEKVAKFKMDGIDVNIGALDATLHTKVKSRFKIDGFPTIEYLEDGEQRVTYVGGRDEQSLVMFAARMAQPVIRDFGTDKIKLVRWLDQSSKERKPDLEPVSFLLISKDLPPREHNLFRTVQAVAEEKRSSYLFASAWGKQVWEWFCGRPNVQQMCSSHSFFLARYEVKEAPQVFDEDFIDIETVQSWIEKKSTPTFSQIGVHNYAHLSSLPGRMLVLAVTAPGTVAEKEILTIMREHARGQSDLEESVRDKLTFAYIDGTRWKSFVEDYGVDQNDLPRVIVLDYENEKYYQDVKLEREDLTAFLTGSAERTLPFQRSGFIHTIWRIWKMPYSGVVGILVVVIFAAMIFFLSRDFDDDFEWKEISENTKKER